MGRLFCKVAHKVNFSFIKVHTDSYIQEKFGIQRIEKKNPFYEQLNYELPTAILGQIKGDFSRGQKNEQLHFLQETSPIFDEEKNKVTFFILVDEENFIFAAFHTLGV